MSRTTVIALAVFAALAVGGYFTLTQKAERGISRLELNVSEDAVTEIAITGPNAVTLKKEGDAWKVSSGKDADAAAVQRLLGAVSSVSTSEIVTTDSGRFAELEVNDEKGHRVVLKGNGKELASFVVGSASKGGANVRVGDEVYVVPGLFPNMVAKKPADWLEKKLFTESLPSVARVEVKRHGQAPYALVSQEGKWVLEDPSVLPEGFRFDDGQARSLVSSLIGARARDILDADPGAETTGLGEASDLFVVHIQAQADQEEHAEGDAAAPVQPATAKTYTLRLGKEGENGVLYAQIDGRPDVVTLPAYVAKNLRKAPTDFRDLKLVELDRNQVTGLEIRDGAKRLVFTKKDGAWTLTSKTEQEPEGFELDPGMVDRRVTTLMGFRASAVADTQSTTAAGLTRPSGTITATLEDGKKVTVRFGKELEEGKQVYVSGALDDAVYVATQWGRNNLLGGLDTFKQQQEPPGLANIDPSALSGLPPEVRKNLMQQIQQKQREQEMVQRLKQQAQ